MERTNCIAQITSDELILFSLSLCWIGSGRKMVTG